MIAAAFAPACLSCARVLDAPTNSPVCGACWIRISRFTPPLCDTCGVPLGPAAHGCPACADDPRPSSIRRCRVVGAFDGVLRDVIHAFKFEGRRSLATQLAPLVRESASDVLRGADAVIPVPLHPWRHWRRGFNQAALVAATLDAPVWNVLARARATRAQSELDGDARHANVAGAFTLAGWSARERQRTAAQVSGRTLVLVDDVLTTGATLEACAAPLLAAGAREVRALTIARAMLASR